MPVRKLEIVVPVFNESQTIEEYFRRFSGSVGDLNNPNWEVTLILVNDGSRDSTAEIIKRITQTKNEFGLKVLTLSRNFGHQQAVWAGIEHTSKDSCVMVMDADLQDPPEMIAEFISGLEECDVVMAHRATRKDSAVKKTVAAIFYGILGNLSGGVVKPNVGDFWAISERAKENLLKYAEELKFLRGLVSDLGYQVKMIEYDRDARYAGTTHYTILKMIQLAIAGVTGFTIKPLIYSVYIAITISALLLPAAIFLAWSRIFGTSEISPGLTFVGVVVIISISLQFIVMSVLALYVARIAIEVKKRPIYILEDIYERAKRR
jgi:dolichol-phosphate mannosyltransferase